MSLGYPFQDIHDSFEDAEGHFNDAYQWMENAYAETSWLDARSDMRACVSSLRFSISLIRGYAANPPYDWDVIVGFMYLKMLIDAAEPYELTMDDILSTMLQATPTQVLNFVGFLDAYRQSIWHKEFNEEYFSALARGFRE